MVRTAKTNRPKATISFGAVAKKLGCDEDKAALEKRQYRMARARPLGDRHTPTFVEEGDPPKPAKSRKRTPAERDAELTKLEAVIRETEIGKTKRPK